MIAAMIDANHISERLASLKLEMSDLRVANARYWSRKEHTALDKSASALRQQRLIHTDQIGIGGYAQTLRVNPAHGLSRIALFSCDDFHSKRESGASGRVLRLRLVRHFV